MSKSTSGASPESPRYFYTDPLAAAWMAKHFGMRLLADDGDDGLVDAGARFIDCDDTFRELWQHDFSYLGKLYIHPDSLALLEPKDGDAVEFDRWHWERQRHEDMRNAPYQSHFGRVHLFKNTRPDGGDWLQISSAGVGWDDNYHGQFALPFKVIQRNGKAFMWPESEAA